MTGEEKRRATRRYTDNAEAYQLYLRGPLLLESGDDRRTEEVDRVLAAGDHQGSRSTRWRTRASPTRTCRSGSFWVEAISEAKAAALKAIELDPTLAEAHVALGHIKLWLDWEWPAAELEFKQGIALNPNSALAHDQYAMYLAAMGRLDEAIERSSSARRALDCAVADRQHRPRMVPAVCGPGSEAVDQFRKTLELDPNYVSARWGLGASYAQQQLYKRRGRGVEAGGDAVGRQPADLGTSGLRVWPRAACRRMRGQTLAELNTLAARQYVPSTALALVYAGLGDKAQALEWLGPRVSTSTISRWCFWTSRPGSRACAAKPGFEQLLRRMQLPERSTGVADRRRRRANAATYPLSPGRPAVDLHDLAHSCPTCAASTNVMAPAIRFDEIDRHLGRIDDLRRDAPCRRGTLSRSSADGTALRSSRRCSSARRPVRAPPARGCSSVTRTLPGQNPRSPSTSRRSSPASGCRSGRPGCTTTATSWPVLCAQRRPATATTAHSDTAMAQRSSAAKDSSHDHSERERDLQRTSRSCAADPRRAGECGPRS